MSSSVPKFAHVVFQTGQPGQMRNWYCTVLDGHVMYEDAALTIITFAEEHHRGALIHPPTPLERKSPGTPAMHHVAYTFQSIDDLLDRYVLLRDQDIRPADCIAHGVTTSLYYRDPGGKMVELQIDRYADQAEATRYMNGSEYAADSVDPAFDAERMPQAGHARATIEELCDHAWALQPPLPDPMPVLLGAS